VVDLQTVTNPSMAEKFDVKLGTKLITYDFVLLTELESMELRTSRAQAAMERQGIKATIIDGLPIPDLD